MITKLVLTDSFDFDDASISVVRFCRSGVEGLKKTASHNIFADFLKDFKPAKDATVIHVIAVGDEERYGPNRNGDAFSGEDNKKAHGTFKELGYVFRNHVHDDPKKAVGSVEATAYHPDMSRIELLLSLDPSKCPREIEAIETGKDVPVSMGSAQDYDICSLCGHKAATPKQHCEHIKFDLGKVAADGTKIYMKNPNPKFFDISLVHKPADRIAYMLKKVAGESSVIGGHDLAEAIGLGEFNFAKTAAKRAIATLIKQVPMNLRGAGTPCRVDEDTLSVLKKAAAAHGLDQVLYALTKSAYLLHPSDFGALIGHPDAELCASAAHGDQGFQDIMDDHTEIQSFEAPAVPDRISKLASVDLDLALSCGMTGTPYGRRVLTVSITPVESVKYAGAAVEAERRGFAALYAHYKVAWAVHHSSRPELLKALAATF